MRQAIEAMQAAAAGRDGQHVALRPDRRARAATPTPAVALAAALGVSGRLRRVPRVPHRAGRHADVTLVRTEKLSIGVDEVRSAASAGRAGADGPPLRGLLVIEDARPGYDGLRDALLKQVEAHRPRCRCCAPHREALLPPSSTATTSSP